MKAVDSETVETLEQIPVLVPSEVDIYSIADLIEEDILKVDSKDVKCSVCKKETTVDETKSFVKLPSIVIILLKIFKDYGDISKNSNLVNTPDIVLQEGGSMVKYKCFAKVNHHGVTIAGGHYTCEAYNSTRDDWVVI